MKTKPKRTRSRRSSKSKAAAVSKKVRRKSRKAGPSPRQQLTIQASRALQMWQQETANKARQAAALDVAKLALELARLRGTTHPLRFLDEAARLLTDAGLAIGWEQSRPERERREQLNKLTEDLAGEFQANQVPFDRLCRLARADEKVGASDLPAHETFSFTNKDQKEVSFEWRVFRDQRELKKLLAKHASRIYQQAGKDLNSIKANRKGARHWGKAVVALLDARYWLSDEWRKKFLKVKEFKDGATLRAKYIAAATQAFSDLLWSMAKTGTLDVITLYSIHNTRQETYKTRGPNQPKPKSGTV